MPIQRRRLCWRQKKRATQGFGLNELMISLAAGTLIVGASGLALRSTGSMLDQSTNLTTLRQNKVNGLRLMRAEIERSDHLLLPEGTKAGTVLDLNHPDYESTIKECKEQAGEVIKQDGSTEGDIKFTPFFGVMMNSSKPILYGISLDSSGRSYNLQRCGVPIGIDGSYSDASETFLASVITHIKPTGCDDNSSNNCETKTLQDTLNSMQVAFTGTLHSGNRSNKEPYFHIQSDENYKLIKIVDSSVRTPRYNDEVASDSPLYFTAFARADKQWFQTADSDTNSGNYGLWSINPNQEEGADGSDTAIQAGSFFPPITSKNVRFVVDGSGSMSACVMWAEGYDRRRTFYDPGQGYFTTSRICALTRMEALIAELTAILELLPDDTKVGVRAFSSGGYANHKRWTAFGDELTSLNQIKNGKTARQSVIAFVNTLDDDSPNRWGGTDPWDAMQAAFDDQETDTLYFLSDGKPNKDRNGGSWRRSDYERTADYYADLNRGRTHNGESRPLEVNTTSLGLTSDWMKMLSEKTSGIYNEVNEDSL